MKLSEIAGAPWWTAILGCAVLGMAAEAQTIRGVGVERTLTCDDRDVEIHGTNHRLTLRGRCERVEVHGTGNFVHVEGLGRATISGVKNHLEWEYALRGDEPRVSVSGLGSRVVRAEGGAARRPASGAGSDDAAIAVEGEAGRVTIGGGGISVDGGSKRRRDGQVTVSAGGATVDVGQGKVAVGVEPTAGSAVTVLENDLQRTFDCAGGGAVVHGNRNELRLRNCPELVVTGNTNDLTLTGPVRLIRLLGNENEVAWSEGEGGKPPRIETLGSGNRTSRK